MPEKHETTDTYDQGTRRRTERLRTRLAEHHPEGHKDVHLKGAVGVSLVVAAALAKALDII